MHFPSMIVFLVWVMVRKIEWMPQVRASLCLATFWPNHPFTVPVDAAKVDGLVWFH